MARNQSFINEAFEGEQTKDGNSKTECINENTKHNIMFNKLSPQFHNNSTLEDKILRESGGILKTINRYQFDGEIDDGLVNINDVNMKENFKDVNRDRNANKDVNKPDNFNEIEILGVNTVRIINKEMNSLDANKDPPVNNLFVNLTNSKDIEEKNINEDLDSNKQTKNPDNTNDTEKQEKETESFSKTNYGQDTDGIVLVCSNSSNDFAKFGKLIKNSENGDAISKIKYKFEEDVVEEEVECKVLPCETDSPVFKSFNDAIMKKNAKISDSETIRRFSSFCEKNVRKPWRRRSLGEELNTDIGCKLNESIPDLNKSRYSLISCTELTPEVIQLFQQLPEEIKYDPAFQQIRSLYEKEFGTENARPISKTGRLPLVSSAPHLNKHHHGSIQDDPLFAKNKKEDALPTFEEKGLLQESDHSQTKKSTLVKAAQVAKMSCLLAVWIFFTAAFLIYNEKEEVELNSSIAPGETKHFFLQKGAEELSLQLLLSGPFLSDAAQQKLGDSQLEEANKMNIWLESSSGNGTTFSRTWSLVLLSASELDFNSGEPRTAILELASNSTNNNTVALLMRTSFNTTTLQEDGVTVPFKMSYTINPLDSSTGVIYAGILLCGLYVLIIFEVMNRTMAAVIICTASLGTLAIVGQRPSIEEVVSWLDVETLLLLFSMMILVAIMAETGMFDYLAVFTFGVTKGKLWPLITLLCAITAVLSTFLDNVTTVLLITPVTIRLCEVMDLDPIPILMSMVLFSNIGGTATPVGDPPNVIIASNKAVIQAGINFTNFTIHMTLGILLVCIQTYVQLRIMFRDTNKMRIRVPRDIQELRHQISIWKRAADSLPYLSKDVQLVKERLERKVRKLQSKLVIMEKEANKRACPKDTFQSTLKEMKDKYKIRDKVLLVKSTVAICFVVLVFFLHAVPELNRISLGWTALLGAILLLILADREDLEPILHRVEWSTLLFFAALFVLMEALSVLGLIDFIGRLTQSLILRVDENARLAVALLLILWVSGISSAFVDNIPLTTMMVRVVTGLGSNPHLGLPMAPLIWALSFGACLGGNGTLIGASANVVCAGVAEQHGYKFTFVQFFKIGFPIMIGHLIVASVYLLLCHCAFSWH